MTVLVVSGPLAGSAGQGLGRQLATALDTDVDVVAATDLATRRLEAGAPARTIVLGHDVPLADAVDLAGLLRVSRPEVGVVLVRGTVDADVLGEALRAGVREVVARDDLDALATAVQRSEALTEALTTRRAVEPPLAPRRGTVITVFSAKGGCGKTTMATNLAAVLADRGRRRVVVVDLDLAFGDVAIAMQLFPTRTIADAAALGLDGLDLGSLQALLTPHSPGLTTLVAPVTPGAAEGIPAAVVTRILELLREHFDVVVVDTPPAFADQVLAAFDLSDVMVLLATLDIPALKNLKLTLETLDLLDYPRDRWRVVLNRADSKVGLSVAEVEKTLRVTLSAHVPSSRDVPASLNRGVPLVLEAPRHPVSQAIQELAEQLVGEDHPAGPFPVAGSPRAERRVSRGLLRRRPRLS